MNTQTQKSEIQNRLEKLAYRRTKPFCMGCYQVAPSGRCTQCGSDDCARILAGDGVDWGVDWIIRALLREELTPANVEEAFEESVRGCYEETVKIGWIEYDTVSALKELDPISWRLAESEHVDQEASEGNLLTFDGEQTYYWLHDVERFLDESETSEDCA